jgi:hypothetical protein
MIRLTRFISYKSYIESEKETTKLTSEKFKKELMLYARFFDLFMETIDCIGESTESKLIDSEGKNATIIILPRVVQSIESIRLLTTKGHYYDSAIIERSLLESLGLCAHLSSNEEEAKRWIRGEKIKLPSIDLLDFPRWLHVGKDDDRWKKFWNVLYGQLCNYVHTNIRSAASLIRRDRKKEERIGGVMSGRLKCQYAALFDGSRAREILADLVLATLIVENIFKEELRPYKKRQRKLERLIARAVLTFPKSIRTGRQGKA